MQCAPQGERSSGTVPATARNPLPPAGFLGIVQERNLTQTCLLRLCAPSGATQYSKRAVLANSPNSIPPERVFSCLNNFFTPGHENSYSDYIEYATQLQFNHNQST